MGTRIAFRLSGCRIESIHYAQDRLVVQSRGEPAHSQAATVAETLSQSARTAQRVLVNGFYE